MICSWYKGTALRVATLCVLVVIGCALPTAAAEGATAWTWEYDDVPVGSLPDGFHVTKGEPAVDENALLSRKAVRLRKEGDLADGFLVRFPEVTDRVVIEFTAYIATRERNVVVTVGNLGEDETALSPHHGVYLSFLAGGALSYYSGRWTQLGDYYVSLWNTVRVEVDVPSQSFVVYINGSRAGTGAFRGPVEAVNAVEFSMFDRVPDGVAWIGPVTVTID
ncbi:MAG: hypothetical protein GX161_03580 [Firmicutes bacterium]|nr:hypothetical protein [Bacillota bacterium]